MFKHFSKYTRFAHVCAALRGAQFGSEGESRVRGGMGANARPVPEPNACFSDLAKRGFGTSDLGKIRAEKIAFSGWCRNYPEVFI